MADDNAAPAANDTAAPATPAPAAAPPVLDTRGVADMLAKRREQPATPEPAGAVEPDTGSQEPAVESEEPAPDESEASDAAEGPPIDPPRTWSKAEKEAFAALPREHQLAVAERERERDSHYQRGLQDAAQARQAALAERQAAEQARQQYEHALPELLQQYSASFQNEFHDIKSWEDVENMRVETPMRHMRWRDMREMGQQLQVAAAEAEKAQKSQVWQDFTDWRVQETQKLLEQAPELKDPEKAPKAQADVASMFRELGFRAEELQNFQTYGSFNFHDHRIQLIVRDAARYRAAQKAAKAATPKALPPVQRPGAAPAGPRGAVSEAHLRDLTNKAKQSGSPRDLAALLAARRKSA